MDDSLPIVPDPQRPWFEPLTAVLMAVSSLSTAWCSYQSSRWSGHSTELATLADRLERQAAMQHLEAMQIQSAQLQAVTEAIDARLQGKQELERFYTERFRGELAPAYEKWLALKPFEDPAAPPHPFVPELYTPRFEAEIRAARAEAAHNDEQARHAAGHASGFLGNTVILATVLFFAGTSSRFAQRRVRWSSLGFALALFLYAAVCMLRLPVA